MCNLQKLVLAFFNFWTSLENNAKPYIPCQSTLQLTKPFESSEDTLDSASMTQISGHSACKVVEYINGW